MEAKKNILGLHVMAVIFYIVLPNIADVGIRLSGKGEICNAHTQKKTDFAVDFITFFSYVYMCVCMSVCTSVSLRN